MSPRQAMAGSSGNRAKLRRSWRHDSVGIEFIITKIVPHAAFSDLFGVNLPSPPLVNRMVNRQLASFHVVRKRRCRE